MARFRITRYDEYPYRQDEAPWVIVTASTKEVALHVAKILLHDYPKIEGISEPREVWSYIELPGIVTAPDEESGPERFP